MMASGSMVRSKVSAPLTSNFSFEIKEYSIDGSSYEGEMSKG